MKRFIAAVSFAILAVPAAAFAAAPYDQSIWATGAWADDPSFIAPAQ
jgi:hypothetical protein